MSGVGRFIRKKRAKRAAFMADPAIIEIQTHENCNSEYTTGGPFMPCPAVCDLLLNSPGKCDLKIRDACREGNSCPILP